MSRGDSVRKEILLQLYGVRPLTRDADALHREAQKQELDFSREEIKRELAFLADEGLLIEIKEPGCTARRYRLHASGVRLWEEKFSP